MTGHPPLPKDPRHQRFADLRLRGASLQEAAAGAGYQVHGRSSGNAKRLEDRADVRAYMEAVRQQAAATARFDREKLIRYCEDILLTAPGELDSDNHLCQEFRENEATGERVVKMPNKLLAAKQLAELHGWNKPQEIKVDVSEKLTDIVRRIRAK
jgi:hypothetical protein